MRIESVGVVPDSLAARHNTVELAKIAAEDCLRGSTHDPSDLDLLIYSGVYRDDFICEPAIAALIAGALGINDHIRSPHDKRTFAFDVFNGALGFLNACHVAVQAIQAGRHHRVLVVASEIENNATVVPDRLLGLRETGSAAILDQSSNVESGFGNFIFRHSPEHINDFVTHAGLDPMHGKPCLYFEKSQEFEEHCLECIPNTVAEMLALEGLKMSQIKAIFPPQASPTIISTLGDRMGIPKSRFVDVTNDGLDLFTSSLPYALHQARRTSLVGPGDIGLFLGVGSGIQVGCAIYYF